MNRICMVRLVRSGNRMNSFLAMVRSNIVAQAVLSIALGMLLALMPQITTLTVIYLLALCLEDMTDENR